MENRREVGSTSSSFTNDLFGAKVSEQSPSSTGSFSSIFPPPSAILGKSNSTEFMESNQGHSTESKVEKKETTEDLTKNKEDATYWASKEERSCVFQQRLEPSPLSSSLHYGGQEDMYVLSSDAQKSGYPDFKKGGAEDDRNGDNSDSTGNWWQGSVYY